MKRQIAVILITLSLAAFSRAQGTNEFFDGKKSQEELEIMKGILNTTISFITKDYDQKGISIRRNPSIQAFYLAGQGAVFVIPISSSPSYSIELSRALDATRESLNELRYNLKLEKLYDGSLIAPAPPAPPATPIPQMKALEDGSLVAPAPPSPPRPPESPIVDQEKLKAQIEKQMANIEEYKEKAEEYRELAERQREEAEKQREEVRKAQMDTLELFRTREEKSREEQQKRREELLQSLADIKIHLIEALANYGDSLTTVQSDEYINLILNTEGLEDSSKKRFDTISAQKSWITDYKAGRLSLEDFKQKVRQYTQ